MSFQSSKKARSRRRATMGAIAVVAGVAVYILMCGRAEEPEPPRVLGTGGDTTGYYEEEGVFEEDTTGDVVTITEEMAGDTPAAPAPAVTPAPSPAPARAPAQASAPEPAWAPEPASGQARERTREAAPPTTTSRAALALNNKAWGLHQAGKYAEAEDQLREVIRMAPSRAIAYANLGESLWKLGRNDEAAAMYRKFLELNTDPRRERIATSKIAQITGQ